tara:strand:- start:508 stop:915 length:408 start_codon:yes stop_codon:yes gene_type:complete
MSDAYKILGQADIDATGTTALYTVPSPAATSYGSVEVSPKSVAQNVQTLVTSLAFSFVGTASQTIKGDLTLSNAGATAQILFADLQFYSAQNSVINMNMTLPPASVLNFVCDLDTGGNLYITVFGVEMSTGYGPS